MSFPYVSSVRTDYQSSSPFPPQTSPQSALSEPRLLAGTHMHIDGDIITKKNVTND